MLKIRLTKIVTITNKINKKRIKPERQRVENVQKQIIKEKPKNVPKIELNVKS